jgi:hypothetical protein
MPGKELVPRPAVQPPAVTRPPWEPDKASGKDASAWQWLWQRRHWSAPLLLLPALWLTGAGLHLAHTTGYVVLAGALATAFMVIHAPRKWDRRPEQAYAIASAAALSAWLAAASEFSPFSLWLAGPLVLAVAVWGFFWWRHKRPRGMRRRQKLVVRWDTWWQSHAWHWNLGGSQVIDVTLMGVTTRLRIQGLQGRHSIVHVRAVMHLIETATDGFADIGMVRAEPVKGKPSQFDLFLKKENPLRAVVVFDPALAPKSVHEPLVDGMSESGSWKTISARSNRFILGMTRTGKSNDLLVGLAQLTGCADDHQILIDLKCGRSGRPVLEAASVAYVVTEVDEARMVLAMLVAEAKARMKHAYDGNEQLLASEAIPAIHTLVDETHDLTAPEDGAGDPECRRLMAILASQGNGIEEYLWVYTQHGSLETSVGTEQIRANLPCRTVYRVAEARHGAYAIPEFHKLDASKLEEQGTHYLKDGKDALPEQVRAPHMPHSLLKKIAAQNTALSTRRQLVLYCGSEEAVPGVTWQQWWDSRWSRLDPAFHAISPQYAQYTATVSAPSPAAAWAAGAPARAAVAEAAGDAMPSEPGEGSGAQAAARMGQELDALYAAGVPAPPARPDRSLKDAITRQKDAFAEALESAPGSGISPKQLMDESGMASTWVHVMLGKLQERTAVRKISRGRYTGVPGAGIRQVITAIEAGNEQLYREARQKVNAA